MVALFLIVLIDLVGFGLVIPLLPFYAERFGASPAAVTMLLATYSFGQFLMAPVWGRLSDRYGRKPILLTSLCFSIGSYLWMGFAGALWMLFAARLLAGVGAGNITAAQAYIADVTPPERRAKGMGLIGAAFGLGFTIGPALGGLISGENPELIDLARPPLVAAGFSAIALILTLVRLPESLPPAARSGVERPSRLVLARSAFARPALRQLVILFFITIAAFAGMESTFALWAEGAFGWGPKTVGFTFFYLGLILAAMQGGLVGKLAERYGEARLVTAGAGLIAAGLFAIPLSMSPPYVLLASALLAAGMGLLNPSINSLLSLHAGADERGGILGVSQSAGSLARIVGPIVAGALFNEFGRNAPYYLDAVVMAGVLLLALRIPRERPVAPAAAAPERLS
jgi:MFS transporter, DHA1 family, tetracycline resistance protein